MYTFELNDDQDNVREITKLSDIAYELEQLKLEKNYTLGIGVKPDLENIFELAVVNSCGYKGIFKKRYEVKYFVMADMKFDKGVPVPVGYLTSDFDEVKTILQNFIEHQKAPDTNIWT